MDSKCEDGAKNLSVIFLKVPVKLQRKGIMLNCGGTRGLATLSVFLALVVLCHTSPAARERGADQREFWNPYFYPKVRSLALAPHYPRSRSEAQANYLSADPNLEVTPESSSKNIDRRAISQNSNTNSISSTGPANKPSNHTSLFGIDLKNFSLGNATAIGVAINEFIKSSESIIRELLITTQSGLLQMIGRVDRNTDNFQKELQGYLFRLALAGQMASAEIYHALPPFVNKLIQKIGTPTDPRAREMFNVQLNEAIGNLRRVRKMFLEAFAEHEVDFHNVFQERFTQINKYLRVPEIPKRPFGWFPRREDEMKE